MGSMVRWLVLPAALVLSVTTCLADPTAGPWTNLPVCTAQGGRFVFKMVSDGRQGAIVAWYDERDEATRGLDVYVQALNAGGIAEWIPDGVPLCTAPGDQFNAPNVGMSSDADGGAIAGWTDYRDPRGFVYAQRVDRRGRAVWAPNGINVAPSQEGANPRVEADGSGGAFIGWEGYRGANGRGIYVQRVDSEGRLLWGPGGVGTCTVPGFHYGPGLASDGAGGVIVVWTDTRQPKERVYGQHVNAQGTELWTHNGIPLCNFDSEQRFGVVVGDGAGGAIAIWKDSRNAGRDNPGVFAERVDGSGQGLWDPGGTDLSKSAVSDALFPVAFANRGGAIVAWHDRRSGQYDIYAQSVSESGTTQWGEDGAAVCIAPSDQVYPAITSDEAGGALLAWSDYRAIQGAVYVQHVDESGAVLWGTMGIQISVPAGAPWPSIAGDGRGGAWVAWPDNQRFPTAVDVLAERIGGSGPNGRLGEGKEARRPLSPVVTASLDGDGASVHLSVRVGRKMRLVVYDVAGRRVRGLIDRYVESGEHVVRWDARDEAGRRVTSGVYFVRVQTDEGIATLRTVVVR